VISRAEVLMGRDSEYPLTPELEANLVRLLASLNRFRTIYGKPMFVTSGYRPGKYNTKAGGAPHSAHLTCEACDFADGEGKLADYCIRNLSLLEKCGLWMESPAKTKGWVHLQIRPVPGKRVFEP
jgi:hypothetical protein